jgi:hypothetical protein
MFVRLKEKRDIRKNKVEKYIYWKKGFSVKNIYIEKKNKKRIWVYNKAMLGCQEKMRWEK